MQKCCVSVAKHIAVMINRLTSTNLAAKDSKKRTFGDCGDGPMSKCWKVLEEAATLLQPIDDFDRFSIVLLRMNNQREDCLTFFPKRIVEDGIHTKPLHL